MYTDLRLIIKNMKIKHQNILKEKIIVKLLGLVYRLDNSGSPIFEKNGEAEFLHQFRDGTVTKNPVIFDVGANVGEYSEIIVDLFSDAGYSLHVFEPQKDCLPDLQKKFSENKKIVVNNFGLSDTEETAVIYKDEGKSVLGSLFKRNLEFHNKELNIQENIELKKADAYIESKNISHIHLLKIDVEGNEIKTLNGFGKYLNSGFIDFIQFEYGGTNLDSHTNLMDFYTLLEKKGFKICKVMKKNLEYRTYNPRFDNFVYQNYVAVSNTIFDTLIA